jgi:rod shape-determining protein MreD
VKEPKAVILIFISIVFALLLQSTLFQLLSVWNVRPDLCLMIIVFTAIQRGSMAGMLTGFTAGMLEGFFTPPYGFHALAKTILGYALGKFEGILSIDPFFMKILLVIGATWVKGLLTGFEHLVFGIAGPPLGTFILAVLLESVYNALLALFVFFLLGRMKLFKVKGMETV